MKNKKRIERTWLAVQASTKQFDIKDIKKSLDNMRIQILSEQLGIHPSNLSMELNRLFHLGKLVKIRGRPTYYLAMEELEKKLGRRLDSNEFDHLDRFLSQFDCDMEKNHLPEPPPYVDDKALNPSVHSALDELIGSRRSLLPMIKQAKASILYPPNGLHTLLIGPTGCGKSLFATSMYDYAIRSNAIRPESKFTVFNCASLSDNPQLLLSHLFGYVKGAFTGADKNHIGLVEYTDGGILFLDEIHRLNHEGQEKLFLLMDNGTFSRIGETNKTRHATVMIIGATTINPTEIMLDTFMRRIQVCINMPSLMERTIEERFESILYFFWLEAKCLKKRLLIEGNLINIFCFYECKANIGQLSADIKSTCANAYLDYLCNPKTQLKICLKHICDKVKQGLLVNNSDRIGSAILKTGSEIVIDGNVAFQYILSKYEI